MCGGGGGGRLENLSCLGGTDERVLLFIFLLRCFITEKKTRLSALCLRRSLSAAQNSSALLGFKPRGPFSPCSLWAQNTAPGLRPKQEGRFRAASENRMFFLVSARACVCCLGDSQSAIRRAGSNKAHTHPPGLVFLAVACNDSSAEHLS